MKNNTFLIVRWLNVLVFLAMVAVNALAVILPINGVTPGQVSDMYPSLFTPAAITFSIWSLIYFLLFLFAFYQAGLFTNDSLNSYDAAKRIGWLFIVSSLLNVAWVFCWHYDLILLALVCMFGILISLAMVFSRITSEPLSAQESIFVKLPFAVYFGWITVAAIANVATALVSVGWNGFGISEPVWTIIALILGLVIGVVTILRTDSPAYGLAVVWGYLGILIKHLDPMGYNRAYPAVIAATAACMVVLLIELKYSSLKKP